MRVLLVGDGQLGTALRKVFEASAQHEVTIWRQPTFDMTLPATTDEVAALAPDVVINASAWTNVDGAEANPDAAYAVNALGPKYLAEGCARCGAALVQVSTNEVFPGHPGVFYREYDRTQAISSYARSKLAGEIAVTQMLHRLYIVRVAWLFGPGGANFPAKIVEAANRLGSLRVVSDEFGNPTYAPDAAAAIVRLVESGRYGLYHLVNEGWTSRHQFAQQVLAHSGRGHIELTPISHKEWQRTTQPPLHAVLVNQSAAALDIRLRPWEEAVEEYCRLEFGGA
jgi:dTDP-4-dehydrorhamnose reductase